MAWSVRLDGLDDVLKRLDNAKIRRAAKDGMQQGVLYVHSTVPAYPAPPPLSTYRRTGTLGRGITTDVRDEGDAIQGVIGTNTPYAPYVIDEDEQTSVHAGRWWVLQDVVRKAIDGVVQRIRDSVAKVWEG